MKHEYDVIVIGAGSGGLTAAVGFSKVGKTVLLVEREHMGGECTNTGCIPSKTLLHHAEAFFHAKQISGETTDSETYKQNVFTFVRQTISDVLAEETPETFAQLGIDVLIGEAVFTSKRSITVGETTYRYKHAIIATGSNPRTIPVPGLNETTLLTNQNLFLLKTIPKKILILGAGPIGLEIGQALAMLDSRVTIATIDDTFASHEDEAVRLTLKRVFTKLGITIHQNAHLKKVENQTAFLDIKEQGKITSEILVECEYILMAIGRVPNLPQGLKTAGITFDDHCIMVDSQQRTSNKYVYAIGDVAQKLKFTHTADHFARQVVARIASKGLLRVSGRSVVPKVTYTSPEIAQVGLSWSEAKATYTEKRLMRIEIPFTKNDRAKTTGTTDGTLVVIARRLNGAILGAHIIGPRAGELISLFTLAISENISLWRLQKIIFAYPTYSLIIKKAGDQFISRQIKDAKADLIYLIKRGMPKLVMGAFWGALIFLFQQYRISNDYSYQDILFQLLDFFSATMWGPFIYILLYTIRPIIFFPATLLTALSGALFGFWWGILYTALGENASANFAYWIGRFFGKDLRLEDTVIGKWVEALRKNSFETVLLMRLFYVPFDLTNYGAGVVRARWKEYFLATLVGTIPGLTTFVALGAAIDLEKFKMDGFAFHIFDPKLLILSVIIFTTSFILSRHFKKWRAET